MEQVFMDINEVDTSSRKIETFLVEQEKTIGQLQRTLDMLEGCYRTDNTRKIDANHVQMIRSTRNNNQNNQEYNNFIRYIRNGYIETKQKNLQSIERIEGNLK